VSSWLALVLVDTIAVASFARCFTGPGELTAALVTLLFVHLAGLAARGGPSGLRAAARVVGPGPADGPARGTASLEAGRDGPFSRGRWWVLAAVAIVFLPVGIVLGWTFFWVVPGHATWHALDKDLAAAWHAFSYRLSPVPELPGLVLATAWAAGAAGLLAELISSRRKIPALFALAPALGLYLFAAALGTGSWRAVGLAFMAGAACWYLVAVVREHDAAQDVVVATSDTALSVGDRAASYGAGAVVLRMAVLAAVAAAVIGPNLPGAGSQPLVAWHGSGGGRATKSTVIPGGVLPQGIEVSTLVQVAEEEVDNPSVLLFTVHSATATREIIATLDSFNGNRWSASDSGGSQAVPSFSPPIPTYLQRPPPSVPEGRGEVHTVQVFQVALLAGFNLPAWGVPLAVGNAGLVSRSGPGGALVADTALEQGSVYAVSSEVADPSPAQLAADTADVSDPTDIGLPAPVPARLVQLAGSIIAGATTDYQKALDLQNYLTSSKFHYRLPAKTKSGGVAAPLPGYDNLLSFLFQSRTGYCQQFATAFAVLGRIDGLPTRIAVGFLPGNSVGHDAWAVDGTETHAWPQVKFAGYGWIDFEPTPGTSTAGSSDVATKQRPTKPIATPTTTPGRAHNLHHPSPLSGPARANTFQASSRVHRTSRSSAPWLLLVPFALLAWAGGVPLWRRLRLRRARRESRAGILAAWGEALRMLDLAGVRRRRAETYLELARRVGSTGVLSEEAEVALRDLARLATTASYAALAPPDAGTRQALRDAKTIARSARRRVARWQRVVAALDPRSLPA
jgi:hypothetical protein